METSKMQRIAVVLLLGALAAGLTACGGGGGGGTTPSSSTAIYVDASSGASSPDGSSWSSAHQDLSVALAMAASGDQIWVTAGTYYPTSGTDRTASFELVAGVSVYGGFTGAETALDDRDPSANLTILSGDIDKDSLLDDDNSYHVVRGADDAVLDGFTITMGRASISGTQPSDYDSYDDVIAVESGYENDEILRILEGVLYIAGGGMLNMQAAPTVRNCVFEGNYAGKGGAVYNMVQRTYPTNNASYDAATFEDCTFHNNIATLRGGAVSTDMLTHPTFVSCEFLNNTSGDKGGAVYCDLRCETTFVNVLFANNTAERGAALVSDGSSNPSLLYVSVVQNTATDIGGGLYQGTYGASGQADGSDSQSNDPKIMKCLVMGNSSGASSSSIANWHDCRLVVDGDSVVETVDGTITLATHFNDPGNDDFEPIGTSAGLGWSASRDTSNWATEISALTARTYTASTYDTTSAGSSANTYYVDVNAGGSDSGASWGNAFVDLQTALAAAQRGDVILIAQGAYYPTSGSNREIAFVLSEGVGLYGGYPTGGGTRDTAANLTILSGDIDQSGGTDASNSYHVVVGSRDAVLDGLRIERGYADGDWTHMRGGGLLLIGSQASTNNQTINDCVFENNHAAEGGAIACYNYASPVITSSTFQTNTAERGGAILLRAWSDATIEGTTFSANSSTDRGGAVYIDYGAWPAFSSGCVFSGNSCSGHGGAVYIDDNASQRPETKPTWSNCSFDGNSTASAYGGAVFGYNSSCYVTLTSCTFGTGTANSAATGGADLGFRFNVEATLTGCTYADLFADGTVTLTIN